MHDAAAHPALSEPPHPVGPLLVIGGGAMGSAILAGARRAGVLDARVIVAEPDPARRAALAPLGVHAVESASAGLTALARAEAEDRAPDLPGLILLAIKPQKLDHVAAELALARSTLPGGAPPRPVLSILAGVPTARLAEALATPRVIRVMPNTPARIGRGVSAIARAPGATAADTARAHRLFAAVGEVELIDESLMDAFTALAGSGPAYAFYLAEAMVRAGQALGFDHDAADRIVRATISGSAALLDAEPSRTPEDQRRAVTSPGGVTEAACRVLDEQNVADAFGRAITAGRDRGVQLGQS